MLQFTSPNRYLEYIHKGYKEIDAEEAQKPPYTEIEWQKVTNTSTACWINEERRLIRRETYAEYLARTGDCYG